MAEQSAGMVAGQLQRHRDLLRFLVTGGIGFCIDGGILTALIGLAGWTAVAARGVSFPLAVTATWWLNRVWSFRTGRQKPARRQYLSYLAVQLLGLATNFSVFYLLIDDNGWFRAWPLAALAAGAALALILTYTLSRRLVFTA